MTQTIEWPDGGIAESQAGGPGFVPATLPSCKFSFRQTLPALRQSCHPAIQNDRQKDRLMDVDDLKSLYAEVHQRMNTAIEHVRHELSGVRSGRASVTILDNVHVEA